MNNDEHRNTDDGVKGRASSRLNDLLGIPTTERRTMINAKMGDTTMINAKMGDTMIRITPPRNGREGYAQYGTVSDITDDRITIVVQVDIQRHMEFSRADGMDANGIGSFIVPAHA